MGFGCTCYSYGIKFPIFDLQSSVSALGFIFFLWLLDNLSVMLGWTLSLLVLGIRATGLFARGLLVAFTLFAQYSSCYLCCVFYLGVICIFMLAALPPCLKIWIVDSWLNKSSVPAQLAVAFTYQLGGKVPTLKDILNSGRNLYVQCVEAMLCLYGGEKVEM